MSGFTNLNGRRYRPGFTSRSGDDRTSGFRNLPNALSISLPTEFLLIQDGSFLLLQSGDKLGLQ